jgi:CBS domain containing-hemolysin-like protein
MSSFLPVLIIAVLIALNGLFVAAEFAIVGVSRAEIDGSAGRGNPAARLVRTILRDPRRQDRFIATAQLGITLASLGLGMYGEHVMAEWIARQLETWGWGRWLAAHSVASILAVAVLTYFHIVLGEMVPKSLALQQAHRTVLWVAPLIRVVQLAVYPLVLALNGIGNTLLRLAGVDRATASTEQYRTAEEIAYIVRESQAGGLLRKESAEVIDELLQFGDRTAIELMVPRVRVAGLPLGAGPDVLRGSLRSTPHTRYPVYAVTIDEIVGMLHVRDMLRLADEGVAVAREHLRTVPFVPESAPMDQVLAAMRQARTQLAVVMDEHGGTAGIITLEDLFEEVVGDITDRSDEVPEVVLAKPGVVRADGAARLEDVGEALGVVLEHDDVDTVSGLVLALLGRPPAAGDAVVYDHVRFEVLTVRGHGVGSCLVATVDSPPSSWPG